MEATGEHVTGKWIYWAELGAGLLGAALALVSPIVQAEGLTHAFAHAMEQDPTWAEARARYAEVLADRDLARAGYHPVLTVAGRATANHREVVGDYFGLQDIDRSDDFEAFGTPFNFDSQYSGWTVGDSATPRRCGWPLLPHA